MSALKTGTCCGYTAEQILTGITRALNDGNMDVVESLMRMLAVADPHLAQETFDTMKLGVLMSGLAL